MRRKWVGCLAVLGLALGLAAGLSYRARGAEAPFTGTWKVTCVVPGGVNAGTYTVTPYAGDSLGNYLNTNGGPIDPARATFSMS